MGKRSPIRNQKVEGEINMSGIHISDICIGDIAKLKHGRGFMRIDEIDGNEIRERSESGNCAWCDYTLVEAVGRWQERKK